MEVIDEKGRLFGTVNIVDALVVLLVLAVGLAGVALIVGSGGGGDASGPVETRYVTLDLGTQPEFVIEQVDAGDITTLDGQRGGVNITDTYYTTAGSGTSAVVRVGIRSSATGPLTVGGEPLRVGRQLSVTNSSYALNATVRDLGGEPALLTPERTVVLRGTVPNAVASDVSAGDEITVAGNRVATIDEAVAFDAGNAGQRTLYLNASVRTYSTGDTVRFGGARVEPGQTLTLPVAGYQFSGRIDRVGGGLDRTSEQVLATSVVSTETANEIETGDTYRIAGQSVATVQNVTAYGTDNPDRKRVYVGLTVEALGYGDQLRFGTQPVQRGSSVPFRTTRYEFGAEVLQRGTADLQVVTEELLVTDVVDVSVAREINRGDAYRVADQPIATVENAAVYGTNDPDRKRVYVGLSVRALGYGEIPQFGAGRPLREGQTLPFRTPAYEFDGEIVRLSALHPPGRSTTQTVSLEMDNVPPERATSVTEGLTETNAGQTVARITNVTVEPAVITLTSESGDIFRREHPVNKDVTLTVELSVRESDRAVRFKGRTLQEGSQVTLDLGVTTVTATVVELDAS